MKAQVGFYRDILGFEVSYPAGSEDLSQESWVTFKTGACTLALHAGGVKKLGVDAPTIAFRVEEIEQSRQALIARGVKMGNVRVAAPEIWVCDGRDPEGNKFSVEKRA